MRIAEEEHLLRKAKGFKCIFKSEQHMAPEKCRAWLCHPLGNALTLIIQTVGVLVSLPGDISVPEGIMGTPHTWHFMVLLYS